MRPSLSKTSAASIKSSSVIRRSHEASSTPASPKRIHSGMHEVETCAEATAEASRQSESVAMPLASATNLLVTAVAPIVMSFPGVAAADDGARKFVRAPKSSAIGITSPSAFTEESRALDSAILSLVANDADNIGNEWACDAGWKAVAAATTTDDSSAGRILDPVASLSPASAAAALAKAPLGLSPRGDNSVSTPEGVGGTTGGDSIIGVKVDEGVSNGIEVFPVSGFDIEGDNGGGDRRIPPTLAT